MTRTNIHINKYDEKNIKLVCNLVVIDTLVVNSFVLVTLVISKSILRKYIMQSVPKIIFYTLKEKHICVIENK